MMCEFKEATKKVGLTIHPNKTKILSSESSMNQDTKKYMKVGDLDIEILTKRESVKYLGQRICFQDQETMEIKSRIRAAWATFPQISTRTDIKKVLVEISFAPLRCHSFSYSLICSGNMVSEPGTRKNDSINSAKDAADSSFRRKENTKKIERKKGIDHTIEEEK